MNEINKHVMDSNTTERKYVDTGSESFVLEKSIFSNVFGKDIQRIYLYKKAERLAKALQLIAPAFRENKSLHERLERISIGLIDASVAPSHKTREALATELLALSSILAIAKSASLLSQMNADFILQESRNLLQEVAGYEEPRVSVPETPSVAQLARASVARPQKREGKLKESVTQSSVNRERENKPANNHKGHIKDIKDISDRREAILSVIRSKGSVYIKDISMVIRGVSEKTIQRELQALSIEGVVVKSGDRRWTRYSLVV